MGGKEIRTRSGAIVDQKIKIDFCPDSYHHELVNHLDYSTVHSILITHTHEDHFYLSDILCRKDAVVAKLPPDDSPMTLYGNESLGSMLAPHLNERIAYQRMIPFETILIEGYQVTALEAVHCISTGKDAGWPVIFEGKSYNRSQEALFYLIEKDGESILYAHDTDEFTPADMEFLAGRKIDIITMDCTNGHLDLDYIGHMGIRDNLRMREKLIRCGAADAHTTFVAHHFSHNGLLPHEEMEKLLPGFLVSFDSMKIQTHK